MKAYVYWTNHLGMAELEVGKVTSDALLQNFKYRQALKYSPNCIKNKSLNVSFLWKHYSELVYPMRPMQNVNYFANFLTNFCYWQIFIGVNGQIWNK